MKHPLHLAATLAALLASAGMAAAATSGAQSTYKVKPIAAHQSDIVLTPQQDKTIWHSLAAQKAQTAPAAFQASIGADVPSSMKLHAFPPKVADNILTLAGMRYAKINGKVLVVRQRDRKVESIIIPAAAKS